MTSADIEAADRLRAQVGFNQSVDDWCDLLAWDPCGCFVAELGQRIVATITTTTYSTRLAWIGMVLVDDRHRRAGIGRRLMTHALKVLADVECVALDATPLGRNLYEQLGFVEARSLSRWAGTVTSGRPRVRPISGVQFESAAESDLPALSNLDRGASGVDRERVLRRLAKHPRARCWKAIRAAETLGFAMTRPAAHGQTIGPVVASEPGIATAITDVVLRSMNSEHVTLDVWDHSPLVSILPASGLQRRRRLVRMFRGRGLPQPAGPATHVIASPQTG